MPIFTSNRMRNTPEYDFYCYINNINIAQQHFFCRNAAKPVLFTSSSAIWQSWPSTERSNRSQSAFERASVILSNLEISKIGRISKPRARKLLSFVSCILVTCEEWKQHRNNTTNLHQLPLINLFSPLRQFVHTTAQVSATPVILRKMAEQILQTVLSFSSQTFNKKLGFLSFAETSEICTKVPLTSVSSPFSLSVCQSLRRTRRHSAADYLLYRTRHRSS